MNHLKENNVGYFEHMFFALQLTFKISLACIKCFVHAIFPDLFISAATDLNNYLEKKLNSRE